MHIFVIKNIREKKNFTLYKLSKETGLSRTYLRNLENNKSFNPTLAVLGNIANSLGVKIKDLFYSLDEVENLKEEMYRRIDKFGLDSPEVFEISQIIDLLINVKMKED